MRNVRHVLIHFVAVFVIVEYVQSEYVILKDNGPVVSGANITIWATVYTDYHELASGKFTYTWDDFALPRHFHIEESESPRSEWNISYPSPQYYPGTYVVQVKVLVRHWYDIVGGRTTSGRKEINITDLLNGDLHVYQNTTAVVDNSFVSSKQQVTHTVVLRQPDLDFLQNNATQISSYWFIDCHYYGTSSDFTFNYTFKDVGKDHDVAAIVVASYDKLVPITTTTTTTTTTPASISTSTSTSASSTVSTTKATSIASVAPPNSTISKNASNALASAGSFASTTQKTPTEVNSTNTTANVTGPLTPPDFLSPYVCLNTSVVPRDDNRTFGDFHKKVSVRAPVENLTYTGTNWLQPGELMDLQVHCDGSGRFQYCFHIESPNYNVTGNEKCLDSTEAENCTFSVTRLGQNMTVVIVVSNVVSKGVLGVKINMYSAQKHGQLSVIIVPVTCSIIAAVLIVFGVAYYVQKQARFTVEIADFDFGQTDDLEYKTFGERLMDAVNNAVNRVEILDEENTSTSTGLKYGSLQ